ncbi:hypothetical protein Hanom_Chr13g01189121 [Helianthus anomalus]
MHHEVALIAERQGGTCTNRRLSQLLKFYVPYVQVLMQNYNRGGGLIGGSLSIGCSKKSECKTQSEISKNPYPKYPKFRISENRIIRKFGFGFGFGC